MVKLKEIFDYIYYRVYKLYIKWDKEGSTAAIALSMFQSMSLVLLFLSIFKIILKIETTSYSKIISWGWALVFLIINFINEKHYSKKVKKLLMKKWENESLELRKKKGWMAIVIMLIPILLLLLWGILNKK